MFTDNRALILFSARHLGRGGALVLAGCLLACGGRPAKVELPLPPPVAAAGELMQVLSDQELPEAMPWVADVRWKDDSTVWLSCPVGTRGVIEVVVGADGLQMSDRTEVENGRGGGQIMMAHHLGVSDSYLAVASPVIIAGWKRWHDHAITGVHPFEGTIDLDVYQDRLLVLGLVHTAHGIPEDAIAWIGSMTEDLSDLQGFFFSSESPDLPALARCFYLEQGAARFLGDGSLVVAPGAEPGIFHYGPDGRLLSTWQSEAIGLSVGCPDSMEDMDRYGRDPEYRWGMINEMRIADEILPLPQGPGLVVRSAAPEGTVWDLYLLLGGGETAVSRLPVTSVSELSHLRGDVRGDRVVLLVSEYGRADLLPAPPVRPRLIVAELV
jgi:hypothetical protein